MAETKAPVERPLSPHLQIYPLAAAHGHVDRPSDHRRRALFRHPAGGLVADRGGLGTESVFQRSGLHELVFGRLILFGYTWALLHHMLGGIRHLIWDTGAASPRASANGSRLPPRSARSA